jgi:hypothetical protein
MAASAPVPANLPLLLLSTSEPEPEPEPAREDSQSTALTPPGTAFLIATFFSGFRTLHTYMCVSSAPEAQCCESAVQLNEFTRALWKDQREVIGSRFGTSYRTTFPLDWIGIDRTG